MRTSLTTALLCLVFVFVGDIAFRFSLLDYVRPTILMPTHQAVLQAPVEIRWSGPREMKVSVAINGGAPQSLGLQESPFVIPEGFFPRDGGYLATIESPEFGSWIQATRIFQIHTEPTPASERLEPTPEPAPSGMIDLKRALETARTARDRAQDRVRFLREENRSAHAENERLSKELESAYASQDADAERLDHLEEQLGQASDENRVLSDAVVALQMRLSGVIPCTVWGYYGGYPTHGSSGVRQTVVVSDAGGQIFRLQAPCESFRRTDSTSSSPCFCVGSSWGD